MIDGYTRSVLTLIAACLVWLCVRDFAIRPAVGQSSAQPVTITGIELPDHYMGELADRPLKRNHVLPVWQQPTQ